jgi:hypothetical protein
MARFSAYDTTIGNSNMVLLGPGSGVELQPLYSAPEGPNVSITGVIYATTSGLAQVQQSFDAVYGGIDSRTNWDINVDIPVASGVTQVGPYQLLAPVARLIYTNGTTAQTGAFRMYVSINSDGAHN